MAKRPSSTTSSSSKPASKRKIEEQEEGDLLWFKTGTEFKQERKPKNLKTLLDSLPSAHLYNSIKAPLTLLPRNKYCDITGLEAPHTDPKSTLRYHDASVYHLVKDLAPPTVQAYLQIRNAAVILK